MAQRACRPWQHENPPHFPHSLWGQRERSAGGEKEGGRGEKEELVGKEANLIEGRYAFVRYNTASDSHKVIPVMAGSGNPGDL